MSDYQPPQNSSNPQNAQNIGPTVNTGERSNSSAKKTTQSTTGKPEIELARPPKMQNLGTGKKAKQKPDKAWKPLDLPGTLKIGTVSPESNASQANISKPSTTPASIALGPVALGPIPPDSTAPAPEAPDSTAPASTAPASPLSPATLASAALASTILESAQNTSLASASVANREAELLTLIHELNDCNDVLLSRAAQLESDLEKAQTALNTEVEKALFAQNKMAKQVAAEQTSAQQISQTAQKQVAKLVSELEAKEQALSQQKLINENLQIELLNGQERVTQLEHESALISQQHAEEAQARIKAEATSRDFRSRLQRQQRYTMQFKAALEKSLTASHRNPAAAESTAQDIAPPAPLTSAAVTMPKAQRIVPWPADASPCQGIDPHLETLIRNVSKPTHEVVPHSPANNPPTAAAATSPSNPEIFNHAPANTPSNSGSIVEPAAEAKLWQDLERVINTTDADTPTQEPKLNWQAAAVKRDTVTPTAVTPTATTTAHLAPEPLPDTTSESTIAPVVKPPHPPKKKVSSMAAVELPTFEKAKAGSFKR